MRRVRSGLRARCAFRIEAYGATLALQDVSIELQAGEVHALLGENGAGKSTLVKILSGVVKPNVGTMRMGGEPYEPHSIVDARRRGVATAFQELSLVPNLTVAQNLALPRQAKGKLGLVSGAATQKQGAAILNRFGLRLSPSAIVAGLTLAERQRLEITRAFACNPKVLVLDEPTAALAETDWLFGLVRQATAAGAAVLYISHRLAEVRELCQRATVLRNGRSIGTVGLEDATDHNIFEMMVGRSQAEEMQRRAAPGESTRPAVLEAEGLAGGSLKDISLTLREGEILGVAGLEGQGQRALFRALVGLAPLASSSVKVDGASVRLSGPDVALKTGRGIAFLPEERKTEGIFPALATATNIVLPIVGRIGRAGLVSERLERDPQPGLPRRLTSVRAISISGSATFPAATSRRPCWRARCRPAPKSSCFMIRPAASTSERSSRSMRPFDVSPSPAAQSCSIPRNCPSGFTSPVAAWSSMADGFSRNCRATTSTSAHLSPRSPATRSKKPPHEREC